MKFPEENILENWLETNPNPAIDKFIERNLAITEKVVSILKERNIKKGEFAVMLGKTPSEVSKWLSGLHNLTLKSITKMEVALGIDLINPEPVKEYVNVYFGTVPGGANEVRNKAISYEDTDYSTAS
ncbi:helix-turn-helix domain-containing protein [Aquimarina agarivorans]|uniref:helix-turn-helix domain-containing protein n=1 Tax=Aquimarina agarivorans TaxID=980584 RepID=UPI000248E86F|nr:helix-turn-helix transcriptional regulator [Aquimarina agarivorans]